MGAIVGKLEDENCGGNSGGTCGGKLRRETVGETAGGNCGGKLWGNCGETAGGTAGETVGKLLGGGGTVNYRMVLKKETRLRGYSTMAGGKC